MLFSGINAPAPAIASDALCVVGGEARRKSIEKLIAKPIADASRAAISTNLGQRGALIGRTTAPDACFHLLPRLSFSGRCGLPRLSLQRLTKCSLSPYFTSHSPKSCK